MNRRRNPTKPHTNSSMHIFHESYDDASLDCPRPLAYIFFQVIDPAARDAGAPRGRLHPIRNSPATAWQEEKEQHACDGIR